MRPKEWPVNCKKCRSWKDILEFVNNTDSFIYIWFNFLSCSSKFSFLSSCIPKCFWEFVRATGMLLKVKGGWDDTDLLREKITSWACLEISGLKLIFHWKAHFVILVKSLFKSFVAFLILCTVANNEVSSANSFGLHWRPSDKSLI